MSDRPLSLITIENQAQLIEHLNAQVAKLKRDKAKLQEQLIAKPLTAKEALESPAKPQDKEEDEDDL